MIESILAYIILWEGELVSFEEYSEYLDFLFMKDETDDLLVELEFCSDNIEAVKNNINEYIWQNNIKLNYNIFGTVLFEKLNDIYVNWQRDFKEFGDKMYRIWKMLP